MGHLRSDKAEQVLAGTFHPGSDRRQDGISVYFPRLGATFDFSRADDAASFFLCPRQGPPVTTTTRAPRPRMTDDP
jgi:hypothetical protein